LYASDSRFLIQQVVLKSEMVVLRFPIWTRTYSLSTFDHLLIEHQRLGVFGGTWKFVVSCDGAAHRIRLAAFEDRISAEQLVSTVRSRIHLPVLFQCGEGKCTA